MQQDRRGFLAALAAAFVPFTPLDDCNRTIVLSRTVKECGCVELKEIWELYEKGRCTGRMPCMALRMCQRHREESIYAILPPKKIVTFKPLDGDSLEAKRPRLAIEIRSFVSLCR